MNLFDGHVHTPYCPHGSKDSFKTYIEHAIDLGIQGITFTEHAPLPQGFEDPTPKKDSGMSLHTLNQYLQDISDLKNMYQNDIVIYTGLEIDYIDGFEGETTNFLNEYGKDLDDSILSVHFLKSYSGYHCLDYSPEVFGFLLTEFGSIEFLYEQYYKTLNRSILCDLGPYKPKRIGHISLVRKFQKKFPIKNVSIPIIQKTLTLIAKKNYQLDYNGSGIAKPLCGEPYPSDWIITEAIRQGIPLVYGSDAHRAKELKQGLQYLKKEAPLVHP